MKLELLTIGVSHYCEKARWALDRAGIQYKETSSAPVMHYALTLRHRTKRTLPALLTPHGRLIDSTDILHFVDRIASPSARLFPEEPAQREEIEALEHRFDEKLGPQTRKWAYSWGLHNKSSMLRLMKMGIPEGQGRILDVISPMMFGFLKRGLNLGDEAIEKSQMRIAKIFEEVAQKLADGRQFLDGKRFTAADLTFAALAAPCVAPPEYGKGRMLPLEDVGEDMRRAILAMRSTPAGAFAMRLYRDHRLEVIA